jgi:hypothetical protein
MKLFFERHQICLFFVLTFLLSWFPWYAGIAPEVMAMGPSLAAIIIVIATKGKLGFVMSENLSTE